MNRKNNIALIATLYTNHNADLYSDIYFPIINYGIASISKNQSDFEQYYDIENLQDLISTQFGIKIPLIVLKQALVALVNSQKDIVLSLYEKGSKFQIKKKWDVLLNESVEEKLSSVLDDFDKLEKSFQEYVSRLKVTTDKTFLDFFSDNTEDIFKYLDHLDSIPNINENYIHIANFLIEIKGENSNLFNLANNIFWASVVSAFLKRNIDLNIKPVKRVSYYLDSSLVMAILNLDSEINFNYGKELLDIIEASGNIACIHPLTIKEIDSILFSVERSSPKPGSAIESAYYRRSLNPVEILKIRNSLNNSLQKAGIHIENVSIKEIDEIINKYKTKSIVQELRISRSYSYNNGSIRDLHDIFLCDFIASKRGDVHEKEKINSYFVSLNSDLIHFMSQQIHKSKFSSIIHPSNIITDLWLHDPKCSLVRKNGLTEIMSRCLALNNTDVRRKLRKISQYIDKDNLTEDDYYAIYHSLVNRSQNVLKKMSSIDSEKIDESKSLVAEILQTSRQEEEIRKQNLQKIHEQQEVIIKQNSDLMVEIENFKKAIADNDKRATTLLGEKKSKEELIEDLKLERKEIIKISEKLSELNTQIIDFEKTRDKSIIMLKYWLLLLIEVFAVAFFILFFLLLAIKTQFFEKDFGIFFTQETGIFSSLGLLFSIVIFIVKIKDSYFLSPKIKHSVLKKEQIQHWEERNPAYIKSKEERAQLEIKLKTYKQ